MPVPDIRMTVFMATLALTGVACETASADTKSVEAVEADSRGGIRPYDPARKKTLDFSSVDVGDAPLADGAHSEHDLGEAMVGALVAEDRESLEALALSQSEYTRLFPVLIRHPNALTMGPELAWRNLHGESRGDLDTALSRYGGRSMEFVELVPQETLERPKVRILVRPTVRVRDADGQTTELVMLGSVVEHVPSSTWKIVAFRDTP
jgi:hypothetical protein